MTNSDLYIRQTGIIRPELLTHKILIVGAGSIGSWTALCLAKLGCQNITVMDFDDVEVHNAGSQIYKASDEGMPKVVALEQRLNFLIETPINVVRTKWHPAIDLRGFDIVIAAVDNITVRKEIFEHLKTTETNILYIDPRMAGNAIEIYEILLPNVTDDVKQYEDTLFDETNALPIACSERSVVYNVFVVAGMIGDLIAKYANGKPLQPELIIDLENFTLFK